MKHFLLAFIVAFLAACSSPVPAPSITSVSIAPNPGKLSTGQTLTLVALVQGKGKFDPTVLWSSSDACKAKVDASGMVTGISGGGVNVSITATTKADPSKSAKATLTLDGPVSIPIAPGGGC